MDLLSDLWKEIDSLPIPTILELEEQRLVEITDSKILFEDGHITEQYIKLQVLYRFLFSVFVISKTGLDRLDKRLSVQKFLAAEQENMDFYQVYDLMGLKYFYLRSFVHVERLSDEELICLQDCYDDKGSEEKMQMAAKVMEESYKTVLAVNPREREQWYELFPSISGEGRVQGDNIVFTMKSIADYEDGMLKDFETDRKRINIFLNIKNQIETILTKALGMKVIVFVEV